MNKIIFIILFFAGSFTIKHTSDKATATVNQVGGIYIFTDSKPNSDYNYLGTVKSGGGFSFASPQYQPIRDMFIKKIKKEYPQADGIILYFVTGGADRAEAIQLK